MMVLLLCAFCALTPLGADGQSLDGIMSALSRSNPLAEVANVTPENFLPAVRRLAYQSETRDLAALGKQAATVALRIEELQINFLHSTLCTGGVVASQIPSQYRQEVQLGCSMLGAHSELNAIKQKGLQLISR